MLHRFWYCIVDTVFLIFVFFAVKKSFLCHKMGKKRKVQLQQEVENYL